MYDDDDEEKDVFFRRAEGEVDVDLCGLGSTKGNVDDVEQYDKYTNIWNREIKGE